MPEIGNTSPEIVKSPPTGKLDRFLLIGVGAVLLMLALAFWAANGPGVFAELLTAAWALCF